MITKKYIEMCKKFKEIQETFIPNPGDYVYYKDLIGLVLDSYLKDNEFYLNCKIINNQKYNFMTFKKSEVIYLPTLEQLLEYLKQFYKDDFELIYDVVKNYPFLSYKGDLSSLKEVVLSQVAYKNLDKIFVNNKIAPLKEVFNEDNKAKA